MGAVKISVGARVLAVLGVLALAVTVVSLWRPGRPVTVSDASVSAATADGNLARSANDADTVAATISPRVPAPDHQDLIERPTGHTTGPLLLFLPATGHRPANYTAFLRVAAQSGYHVLGLTYFNRGPSVARTCGADAACYTQVQHNRLTGAAPNRFSAVRPQGSILARFTAAIDAATRRDPSGDWSRYLQDGHPRWSDIVLAGHSQGGGESAYIAHRVRVRGVLMFSSPVAAVPGVVPTWMRSPGATSPSRMYGFDDSHDEFHLGILSAWRALHIPGEISTAASPPAGTHLLVTDTRLGTARQAHDRSVSDQSPGVTEGHPRFATRWRWMLGQVLTDRSGTQNTA